MSFIQPANQAIFNYNVYTAQSITLANNAAPPASFGNVGTGIPDVTASALAWQVYYDALTPTIANGYKDLPGVAYFHLVVTQTPASSDSLLNGLPLEKFYLTEDEAATLINPTTQFPTLEVDQFINNAITVIVIDGDNLNFTSNITWFSLMPTIWVFPDATRLAFHEDIPGPVIAMNADVTVGDDVKVGGSIWANSIEFGTPPPSVGAFVIPGTIPEPGTLGLLLAAAAILTRKTKLR